MSTARWVYQAIRPVISISQLLCEPAGLHLKAIALGGVVWTLRPEWLFALLAIVYATASIMTWSATSAAVKAAGHLIHMLRKPSYWQRVPIELGRFDSEGWKPSFVSIGCSIRGNRSIVLTPRRKEAEFSEPEAFLSAYSSGVILLPTGYDHPPLELPRVRRFALYHELAHNSMAGTLIWSSRAVAPASYIASVVTLVLLDQVPSWMFSISAPLLLALFLGSLSPLYRKIAAELHADSQAIHWLSEDSVDDAIAVCDNRLRFWSNNDDIVFRHRIRNLKNWKRYLMRSQQGRAAIPPRVVAHVIPAWWLEYPLAVTLFFVMSTVTQSNIPTAHILVAICAVLVFIARLRQRYLSGSLRAMGTEIDQLLPEEE